MGLIRLWLTAYPEDLDLNFDPATGRRRGKKLEEAQIPLFRYAEGHLVQIDELYLMQCFALLRDVTVAMAIAEAGIASGPKPPRRLHGGRRRGKPTTP